MRQFRTNREQVARLLAATGLFVAASLGFAVRADADVTANGTVGTTVDPTFVFAVSGLNSGQCNGTTITGTGSTSSAVSLGHVDKSSSAVGAQQLLVSSNAGGGYTVFAHVDGPLTDWQGHTIAALGADSTNPVAFAPPGTEAFGYTTDSLLSGAAANRFINGGAKWAGINTTDREVMFGTTTTAQSINCVAYQITISKDTVGGFYGNNVTYTAVPTF